MHFDRLDENYAIVKSNLNFGKVTLTGLTGLCIPVRPVCSIMSILVVNSIREEFVDKWRFHDRRIGDELVSASSIRSMFPLSYPITTTQVTESPAPSRASWKLNLKPINMHVASDVTVYTPQLPMQVVTTCSCRSSSKAAKVYILWWYRPCLVVGVKFLK